MPKKIWGNKNIVGGLIALALLVGFLPIGTSRETASIDWEEITAVDSPKVRVRVAADLKKVERDDNHLKVDDEWVAVPRILKIIPLENGRFDVVATLPLEKYIEGVLAGEMPSSWPVESLKAQAVAARSFFLALKKNAKHKNFDVDSSQFDQVFRALHGLPRKNREVIRRAVRESQGLVLKRHDEYPLQAYFHADCGGVGEKAESVWGKTTKRNKGTSCPFNPGQSWSLSVSKKRLAKLYGLKAVAQIRATEKSESGRVRELVVRSTSGHTEKIRAARLRRDLGFNNLKSTLFEIADAGDSIEFRGRGYGHGVGLCQWGSKFMADNGKNFVQILAHYYPRARIVPISRMNIARKF